MAAAATRADALVALARREGDPERAQRHDALARSARATGDFYAQREELDAGLMEDRAAALRAIEGQLHLAVMADSELRRRHPGLHLEPLRSAEPQAAPQDLPAVTDARTAAEYAAAMAARRGAVHEKLQERQNVMVPAEDPDYEHESEAWPSWQRPDRDAVLQAPKPELRPSPHVIERTEAEPGT